MRLDTYKCDICKIVKQNIGFQHLAIPVERNMDSFGNEYYWTYNNIDICSSCVEDILLEHLEKKNYENKDD